MINKECMPRHIGIIMDGNGRWAKKRGLPRNMGHKKGVEVFKRTADYCREIGLEYLTVYAFSTENWKRPEEEVEGIMKLLNDYLEQLKKSDEKGTRIRFLGDYTKLNSQLIELIEQCEQQTSKYDNFNLNIALNYGGQDEIVNATKKIAQLVQKGDISIDDIDSNTINDNLYTKGQPDVDLIVRPSGEYRLSNFLIWQSAYAEYIFMDVLWPDFKPKHIDQLLEEYARRNRRFGGI